MVAEDAIIKTILLILLASVAAIIYSLRIIVSMDRKLLRIEKHIENMVNHAPKSKKKSKKK